MKNLLTKKETRGAEMPPIQFSLHISILMKATYNETKRKFYLIYKDAVLEFKGDAYPHIRKSEGWKGEKKPTKKQIAEKLRELEAYGAKLERESERELEKLKESLSAKGLQSEQQKKGTNALHFISKIKPEEITEAKAETTLRNWRKVFRTFGEWLNANYPLLQLHELNSNITNEFFSTISNYAKGYQRHFYIYLKALFKHIEKLTTDESKPFKNPMTGQKKSEVLSKTKVLKKLPFSTTQLVEIFYKVSLSDNTKLRQQNFFVFYFLSVTGWRIGDILSLTWKQIDFEQRLITLTHMKTANRNEFTTVIFITPLMEKVLRKQQEICTAYGKNTELVFNVRGRGGKINCYKDYGQQLNNLLLETCEKMGILVTKKSAIGRSQHNYGIHSFRKSVITELNVAGAFSNQRIDYLTGHADDNTVIGQHYLNLRLYPERSTRPLIEHMEEICKLEFFFNKVVFGSEAAHKIEAKANEWLSVSQINEMKMNFWTDSAIGELHKAWQKGTNIKIIETVVSLLSELRIKYGEREVSKERVKDTLQMFEWVNANRNIEKMLTK